MRRVEVEAVVAWIESDPVFLVQLLGAGWWFCRLRALSRLFCSALLQYSWKVSKNSKGSGTSLGVGANLRPKSSTDSCAFVRVLDDILRMVW